MDAPPGKRCGKHGCTEFGYYPIIRGNNIYVLCNWHRRDSTSIYGELTVGTSKFVRDFKTAEITQHEVDRLTDRR